jgi:hypothetical protein
MIVAFLRARRMRLASPDEPGWYYPGPDGLRLWVAEL